MGNTRHDPTNVLTGRTKRRLQNARVVITGSSRGIGRETARLLLAAGAKVTINGRSPQKLATTERTLREEFPNPSLSAYAADVATPEGAEALAAHVSEKWGGLDYLINNAGLSMRGPIGDLAPETITTMIDGNIQSALQTTRAFLPLLLKTRGHVVFVSTVGAIHGFPGISVYSAAKAALERFSESFNAEYRSHGVTSGIIYLGFVENDPDKEILTADGKMIHHQRRAMQSQTDAARAILQGAANRKERYITVPIGVVLDMARRISPRLVTRILARSGGSIHSVSSRTE